MKRRGFLDALRDVRQRVKLALERTPTWRSQGFASAAEYKYFQRMACEFLAPRKGGTISLRKSRYGEVSAIVNGIEEYVWLDDERWVLERHA